MMKTNHKRSLCEHGATSCQPNREGHGEPHEEIQPKNFANVGTCCARCGHVRPHGGWRGTCVGRVTVELRDPETAGTRAVPTEVSRG